jgi:3-hydroxybutyryl-CoA dehydratase
MRTFEDLAIGETAERTTAITDELVAKFAALTGDINRVHLDDDYAATTFFGRRIAHGMISACLIGTLIGTELPGDGTIYLTQNVDFKAPVYPGDEVTVRLEIVEKIPETKKARLKTVVHNQDGKLVLDGTAWVLLRPPKPPASGK